MCDYVVRIEGERRLCGRFGDYQVGDGPAFCGQHHDIMRRAFRPARDWLGCSIVKGGDGSLCDGEVDSQWGRNMTVCSHHYGLLLRATVTMNRRDPDLIEEIATRMRIEDDQDRAQSLESRSVVYFVERDGFIKIGVTSKLDERMRSLRNGGCKMPDGMSIGPLRLLGSTPGGRSTERHLHRQFADYRYDGEWFCAEPEIMGFINQLACNRKSIAVAG